MTLRMAKKAQLVGIAEAAELLGISRGALCHRRRANDPPFPDPIAELRCGPIWRRKQIEVYRDYRDRLPRYLTPGASKRARARASANN